VNTSNQVSIIIPSLNRQEIVLNTVRQFELQSVEEFELIVVDQSDSLSKELDQYKSDNFKFVYSKIDEKGLPNARNVGANLAHGELLLFVDDDIIPAPDLIECYNSLFNGYPRKKIVIGGRIEEKDSKMMYNDPRIIGGRITSFGKTARNFTSNSDGECDWVAGGNFAVTKSFFFEIGGFDTNFIGNALLEDCDFSFSARENGGVVYYSPNPLVEHLRAGVGGTRQKNRSKGMYYRTHNTVYFLKKHRLKRRLLGAFLYLNGIAVKDMALGRHGITAIFWGWKGFFTGIRRAVLK
jgi:GT2 family glycosyltransferase